ncbi:restriction endonuclease [Halorussus salilacus]|uniref:restriction endonuclease n=1 Tax=Halorussus salilacus TaxID=2953750 RepID=UPI00209EFE40|nr:restriction endonuclease [Halorussus salilacus]USZ67573.1 restriction endonuclease [Halorussus salilacus]
MLQAMDHSEFGKFVAALWKRQGWQTRVKRDDGRTFVAVQRPETGEEGLLWAIPASEGEVGGKQVQQFVKLCQQYDVEESAIVSAGTTSDHAEKVAAGTGVELLDGDGVEAFLKQRGLTDLPAEFGGASGAEGTDASGESDDSSDSPLDRLEPVAQRVGALAGSVGSKGVAVAVVVVVALVAVGFLGGPSIPFLGGGGDDITAESASPGDANASLSVAWNAEVTDSIDPNESDDVAYPAPEGQEFVVVQMNILNTGNDSVPLSRGAFQLRANGTTSRSESFADHEGFVDLPLSAGGNRTAWTAFAVPEGSTGTLVYDQNATDATVAVEFERDTAISTNVTAR